MTDPANPAEIYAFPETVCHRTVSGDLTYYPKAEFRGRTVYFCTEYCLRAFLADPERFYPAHSKRRMDPIKCKYAAEKPEA
jgi:YHS domain-containing protein